MKNKTLHIQVKYRRFAFKFGLSAVAVKEYQKKGGDRVIRRDAECRARAA